MLSLPVCSARACDLQNHFLALSTWLTLNLVPGAFVAESCEGIALGARLGLHFLFKDNLTVFNWRVVALFHPEVPTLWKHREEHQF